MLRKFSSALLLTSILSIVALADQAAYITKAQAEKAAAFLKDKKQVRHYCAPCDDKGDRVEAVNTIEAVVVDAAKGYWEVKVNGTGIDLAYVYFETDDGKWKNLAKEMSIKVKDVPKYLPKNGN